MGTADRGAGRRLAGAPASVGGHLLTSLGPVGICARTGSQKSIVSHGHPIAIANGFLLNLFREFHESLEKSSIG
jgi:hypothetical protein